MYLADKFNIENGDFFNKTVLVRVDYNVPTNEKNEVTDVTRIEKSLKTIRFLLEKNAKIVLISHKGRPKGEKIAKYSLKPVLNSLEQLLKQNKINFHTINFLNDCIGDTIKEQISQMQPQDIVILENLRYYSEEENNDEEFAKKLSELADCFVSDAFGAVHRAHASIVGIAKYIPFYYGFLIKEEVDSLNYVLHKQSSPMISIVGGAKVSSKIDVLQSLLNKTDHLIIGGAMAYTFLKAKGLNTGNSLVEKDKLTFVSELFNLANQKNVKIHLPIDHIVVNNLENYDKPMKTASMEIPDNMIGVDIGPKTIKEFSRIIKQGKIIFWNGPMGIFENNDFSRGTFEIARNIARIRAFKVVGGGDSVAAINKAQLEKGFSHISTGGGASLEYIEGKRLPGLVIFE